MLFLKTFGGLSVDIDGAAATGAGQRRKTLALLALLAAAGRRGVSRDKVIACLWPESDTEHARNLLKQACYALRRDLHAPELFLGAVELRLNSDVIASDIGALDDALAGRDLARAVSIYTGPFLDGFYLAGAAEFERWVETTRGALKSRVADALEGLAQHAATNGDSIAAVKLWRQLVSLDPLAARAALGLLRALIAAGERSAALEFGRVHENLVRQELGVVPDPAVSEFLGRLRSEGEPADEKPTSSSVSPASAVEPTPAPHPAPRRRWRLATGAGVLAVLAALIVATTRSGVPPFNANLFAVVPFGTADPELAPLREGLADLVSRMLDGALRLRSVPPTTVMRRWDGHADRVGAQELARRTGAGLVLFGDLARVGRDSVRLHATLFDAQNSRSVAEIERAEPTNRIDRLADSVTLDLMRGLTPAESWAFARLASPGTASLPALKAFLKGEDYLRRYWLDSAIVSYRHAIALDSTYAVALRHLGVAAGWNFQAVAGQPFARAGRFNRGLSPRDSLMIAYSAPPPGLSEHALYRQVYAQEATLLEMIRRYPEDPELWHEIGEVQFHLGFVWADSTWNRARRSFDAAIARDSG
ncbi:MAG TPA: BTAD domain-containing putative transcriptional regulator, partial [Gemmatimonadales bacterium]|nr:BTAD domain-containing putative transcriptional regulator [Gemmatimonadales bacterium]